MTTGELHAALGRLIEERPSAALNVAAVRVQTAEGPADLLVVAVDVENRFGATFVTCDADGCVFAPVDLP
jgi:hypothetical protein